MVSRIVCSTNVCVWWWELESCIRAWVDDILYWGRQKSITEWFENEIKAKINVSDWSYINWFLEKKLNSEPGKNAVLQEKYTNEMSLKKLERGTHLRHLKISEKKRTMPKKIERGEHLVSSFCRLR